MGEQKKNGNSQVNESNWVTRLLLKDNVSHKNSLKIELFLLEIHLKSPSLDSLPSYFQRFEIIWNNQ